MDKKFEFSCCLTIDNIPVNIFSDTPLIFQLNSFLKNGFEFSAAVTPHTRKEAANVYYQNSPKIDLNWGEKDVFCSAPLDLFNGGKNIVYLVLPLIEREKQKQKKCTIHAASCALNGQGILLLGKEGAGKTSTVYKICEKYKAKLIGNDLTTLGFNDSDINLVNGSQFFFFRKKSILKSVPALLPLFKKEGNDPWIDKIKVSPASIGIETTTEKTPLKSVFFVHIDERQKNLSVNSANTLANRLHLNENFSRYIRSSCTVLMDNNLSYWGYIPSFDNETFFENRKNMIDCLFGKYNLRYISGKSDEIRDFIVRETQQLTKIKTQSLPTPQPEKEKTYE